MKQNPAALHYCTHAIEAFLEQERGLASVGEEYNTGFERFIVALLENSVKFVLPDNGMLFDDHDYRPDLFDLFRLPYSIIALEYCANEALYAPDSGLYESNRRIALAFDPNALSAELKELMMHVRMADTWDFPEQAIAIISVYGSKEHHGVWMSSVGMLVVDLESDRPIEAKSADPALLERRTSLIEVLGERGMTKHGLPGTFFLFKRVGMLIHRIHGITPEKQIDNLAIDIIDEARAVYQFCTAINCSNVETKTVSAPSLLNKKRQKKKKVPFFEYKLLELDTGKPIFSRQPQDGEAPAEKRGIHASPRMHLRRGHIRRLGERSNHRVIWVNAAIVGSTKQGVIKKDYSIKGKSPK